MFRTFPPLKGSEKFPSIELAAQLEMSTTTAQPASAKKARARARPATKAKGKRAKAPQPSDVIVTRKGQRLSRKARLKLAPKKKLAPLAFAPEWEPSEHLPEVRRKHRKARGRVASGKKVQALSSEAILTFPRSGTLVENIQVLADQIKELEGSIQRRRAQEEGQETFGELEARIKALRDEGGDPALLDALYAQRDVRVKARRAMESDLTDLDALLAEYNNREGRRAISKARGVAKKPVDIRVGATQEAIEAQIRALEKDEAKMARLEARVAAWARLDVGLGSTEKLQASLAELRSSPKKNRARIAELGEILADREAAARDAEKLAALRAKHRLRARPGIAEGALEAQTAKEAQARKAAKAEERKREMAAGRPQRAPREAEEEPEETGEKEAKQALAEIRYREGQAGLPKDKAKAQAEAQRRVKAQATKAVAKASRFKSGAAEEWEGAEEAEDEPLREARAAADQQLGEIAQASRTRGGLKVAGEFWIEETRVLYKLEGKRLAIAKLRGLPTKVYGEVPGQPFVRQFPVFEVGEYWEDALTPGAQALNLTPEALAALREAAARASLKAAGVRLFEELPIYQTREGSRSCTAPRATPQSSAKTCRTSFQRFWPTAAPSRGKTPLTRGTRPWPWSRSRRWSRGSPRPRQRRERR